MRTSEEDTYELCAKCFIGKTDSTESTKPRLGFYEYKMRCMCMTVIAVKLFTQKQIVFVLGVVCSVAGSYESYAVEWKFKIMFCTIYGPFGLLSSRIGLFICH